MTSFKTLFSATAFALVAFAGAAQADNKDTVQSFYDFLSNPTSEEAKAAFIDATASDWESIGDYSGKSKGQTELVGQISGFFAQLMPDLNWAVEDMIEDGDTVVVRSRATGTPVGPLFGVDGMGRSFDILTIDIHHLEDGKIARTYHVEDWAGALQQLSGK